jgi:hypothetical protein
MSYLEIKFFSLLKTYLFLAIHNNLGQYLFNNINDKNCYFFTNIPIRVLFILVLFIEPLAAILKVPPTAAASS